MSSAVHGAAGADSADRRTSQRFPLHLAVRYRVVSSNPTAQWLTGESLNISSTGILFRTPQEVTPGQGIEACVTWPVSLDNRVPLKLSVKGPIVRCEGNQAAMRFERYEFKTRSVDLPAE